MIFSNLFETLDAQDETSEQAKITWREMEETFCAELAREMSLDPEEMMILLG